MAPAKKHLEDEIIRLYGYELHDAIENLEITEVNKLPPPIIIQIESGDITIIIDTTIKLTGWKFWATLILGTVAIVVGIVLRLLIL